MINVIDDRVIVSKYLLGVEGLEKTISTVLFYKASNL